MCLSRIAHDVACPLPHSVVNPLQLDAAGRSFEQPLELSFQDQYGTVERHIWFGDGYILLAFSTGQPGSAAQTPFCPDIVLVLFQPVHIPHSGTRPLPTLMLSQSRTVILQKAPDMFVMAFAIIP